MKHAPVVDLALGDKVAEFHATVDARGYRYCVGRRGGYFILRKEGGCRRAARVLLFKPNSQWCALNGVAYGTFGVNVKIIGPVADGTYKTYADLPLFLTGKALGDAVANALEHAEAKAKADADADAKKTAILLTDSDVALARCMAMNALEALKVAKYPNSTGSRTTRILAEDVIKLCDEVDRHMRRVRSP